MTWNINAGSENITLSVFIKNKTLNDGSGLTGLVFNSAGLTCYYVRDQGNATVINLVTQTVTGAHTDGGFVEIDATNTPGLYRLDLPDTVLASGIGKVSLFLRGAANMADTVIEIQLDLVDNVWDELLTKSAHNAANSAGKLLRQIGQSFIYEGTAQGAGTGNNQIQFDTGASASDGAYDPAGVFIVGGTGTGQTRLIVQYVGATRIATVDRDWTTNPDATSEFVIFGDSGRGYSDDGLAQGGGSVNNYTERQRQHY